MVGVGWINFLPVRIRESRPLLRAFGLGASARFRDFAFKSDEMKVGQMRQQLRRGDMQHPDRVLRGIVDHRVAGRVVMDRSQQRGDVSEYAFAELKRIGCRREVCEGNLAEIRREHERSARRKVGDLGATVLNGRCSGDDQRSPIAVIGEVEALLRILTQELKCGRARAVGC